MTEITPEVPERRREKKEAKPAVIATPAEAVR